MSLVKNVYLHLKNSSYLLFLLLIIQGCGTFHTAKNISDRELINSFIFSGEGRATIKMGASEQSFNFESLLEDHQWLIEFSKALYGQELLILDFKKKIFKGELIQKNIRRFSPHQLLLLSRFAEGATFLLPRLHRGRECSTIVCLQKRVEGWKVYREGNFLHISGQQANLSIELLHSVKEDGINSIEFHIHDNSEQIIFHLYFKPQ